MARVEGEGAQGALLRRIAGKSLVLRGDAKRHEAALFAGLGEWRRLAGCELGGGRGGGTASDLSELL